MAGRICLVNSVILGHCVHYFQVYQWPDKLLKLLTSSIRNFIWTGSVSSKKAVTVSWQVCCKTKEEGGLGVKHPKLFNKALQLKLAWRLLKEDNFVFDFLRRKFFSNKTQYRRTWHRSSVWSSLSRCCANLLENCIWLPGRCSSVRFWHDNWLGEPLSNLFSGEVINDVEIKDIFDGSEWHLPSEILQNDDLRERIQNFQLGDIDELVYSLSFSGVLTCKIVYLSLIDRNADDKGCKHVWHKTIMPSRSLLMWRLLQGRLPTEMALKRRGFFMPSRCHFCYSAEEDSLHLFLNCQFARALWSAIEGIFAISIGNFTTVVDFWKSLLKRKMSKQLADLWRGAIIAVIWIIWDTRNAIVFNNQSWNVHIALIKLWQAIREVGLLSTGTMANNVQDLIILNRLNIKPRQHAISRVVEVKWIPSTMGRVKVNTDGTAFGSLGPAGLRKVILWEALLLLLVLLLPLKLNYSYYVCYSISLG